MYRAVGITRINMKEFCHNTTRNFDSTEKKKKKNA